MVGAAVWLRGEYMSGLGCFADEIELNVIRTKGWVRWTLPDLVQRLQKVFESYSATQHLSTNHQISIHGDEAVAWSTLNATHYVMGMPGGEFQQQVGYYEHHFVRDRGWRIAKVRQVEHWQRGNQHIFDRTVETSYVKRPTGEDDQTGARPPGLRRTPTSARWARTFTLMSWLTKVRRCRTPGTGSGSRGLRTASRRSPRRGPPSS